MNTSHSSDNEYEPKETRHNKTPQITTFWGDFLSNDEKFINTF